jgi:hypothetical protein
MRWMVDYSNPDMFVYSICSAGCLGWLVGRWAQIQVQPMIALSKNSWFMIGWMSV